MIAERDRLADEGRAWFRQALTTPQIEALDLVVPLDVGRGARLDATPDVLAAIAPANAIARSLLPAARPVRLVAFDKTPDQNWALPWHQDRVVAVKERRKVDGFSNWTRKDGVWHAEPPAGYLERMFFLRIFIDDDTGEQGGGLMIARQTHDCGVIPADLAKEYTYGDRIEDCFAERGDVLACMALLLHRSRGVTKPGARHRRALRIDYSADTLPAPLEWALES